MVVDKYQEQGRGQAGVSSAFRYLEEVVEQAHFRAIAPAHLAALYHAPVPCTAVVVACFRDDGDLLLVRPVDGSETWDLPHGLLPRGVDPGPYAAELLAALAGVRFAAVPTLFGLIDWGPAAIHAGWGWTACLWGTVGAIGGLPEGSWAGGREFLPPDAALARITADCWGDLRRHAVREAGMVFDSARDYWLMQWPGAWAVQETDNRL